MKIVIIASANPVKVEVAKLAFTAIFPDESFEFIPHGSESGVSDQPMSEQETVQGARNRLAFVKQTYPDADYYVGQEGGVFEEDNVMKEMAYIIIADKDGHKGVGKTATFIVPPKIAELVHGGMELGQATDKFFGLNNSKHQNGLIGSLTDNHITRTQLYWPAAIIALTQISHKDWYF